MAGGRQGRTGKNSNINRWNRDLSAFVRNHPEYTYREVQRRDTAAHKELQRARDRLSLLSRTEREGGRVDYSPTGRFARALEELGYREVDYPYDVGKSPKKGKR